VDPENQHHVFTSGIHHGRKIDFDAIPDDSDLYQDWVEVTADEIRNGYPFALPQIVLGVANGTNRLAPDVADCFDGVIGLQTEKNPDDKKDIRLTKTARQVIEVLRPSLILVLEDVGTTGGSSSTVAVAAMEAGAEHVDVLNTWKRRERLDALIRADISYFSVIDEPLPTYTIDECESIGYCSDPANTLYDKNGEVIDR